MNRFPSRLAIAMLAGFLALPAAAADSIAKVNGVSIPAERAEAMLAEQRAQGAPDGEQLKNAVREELVRREVLSQQASSKGLAKKADVQAQMEMAKQAILIRAYLQEFVKNNPVTDAEVQTEYDAIKSRMGDKEYKPRPRTRRRRSSPSCSPAPLSKKWRRNRVTRARRTAVASWAGAIRPCT